MSPVDRDMVNRKLLMMAENLREIETIVNGGWEAYEKTRNTRKLAERYFQETVEAATDVNTHLLVEGDFGVPSDYRDSFKRAGDAGILPSDLVKELLPAPGLRNRIVHQYDVLDDALVFKGLGLALALFPKYIEKIRLYLGKA